MAKKSTKKPSKAAKLPPEPPPESESSVDSLVDRGIAVVNTQLTALEQLIEDSGKDKDGNEALRERAVKATNSLTKSIAALSAEQRQLEKHTRISLERLKPEDEDAIVMEYLRELPRPRRNKFLELLKGLDSNNDLLAL